MRCHDEQEKRWDFRVAKIECAIFQAMCGKWGDGREISIADFLPQTEEQPIEQDNSKHLRAAFEMMAARDAKMERS